MYRRLKYLSLFLFLSTITVYASNNLSLSGLFQAQVDYRYELKPVTMLFSVYSLPVVSDLMDTSRFELLLSYPVSLFGRDSQRLFIDSPLIAGFPVIHLNYRLIPNISLQGKFSSVPYRRDNVFFTGMSLIYHRQISKRLLSTGVEVDHLYGPDHFRLKMISLFSIYYLGGFKSRIALLLVYSSVNYTFSSLFRRHKLNQNNLILAVNYPFRLNSFLDLSVMAGISGVSPFIDFTGGIVIP